MGALNWNPEITQHNQRLFKASEAIAANDSDKSIIQLAMRPFKLKRVSELIKNPQSIHWSIKNVFEKGGMNLISGAYGSGKSLVIFDMAFCVATGIDWCGNKVLQGGVVIIAGEGHSGIAQRFAALSKKYGIDCPDNLHLSEAPADFTDPKTARLVHDVVEATCADASLVVIDTLNRNFGGGDENSTKDMTNFVNNLDAQFRQSSKTVVVIHHTSKSDLGSSRGSVVLPAACEGEFVVRSEGDTSLSFSCKKQKNGKKMEDMFFDIRELQLPPAFTFEGEATMSVAIELNQSSGRREKNKSFTLTQDETHCMDALAKVHTYSPQPIPSDVKLNHAIDEPHSVILISDWRIEAYKRLSVDCDETDEKTINNAKKTKFARVRKSLFKKKKIIEHGEYAWYFVQTVPPTK